MSSLKNNKCLQSVTGRKLPTDLKSQLDGLPLHKLTPYITKTKKGQSTLTTNLRQVGYARNSLKEGIVNSKRERIVNSPKRGVFDPFITPFTNDPHPFSYENSSSFNNNKTNQKYINPPLQKVPMPTFQRPHNRPSNYNYPPKCPCDPLWKLDPLHVFKQGARNVDYLNDYKITRTSHQTFGPLVNYNKNNINPLPITLRDVTPGNKYKVRKTQYPSGGSSGGLPVKGSKTYPIPGRLIQNNNVYPITGLNLQNDLNTDYFSIVDPKLITIPYNYNTQKRNRYNQLIQAKNLYIS